MKSKDKILYLMNKVVKSPCRAAYANKKLPVSLEEIDEMFGSFVNFYKELEKYRKSL